MFVVNLTPGKKNQKCLETLNIEWGQIDLKGNRRVFIHLKGYLGSQQTNLKYLALKLGKQY